MKGPCTWEIVVFWKEWPCLIGEDECTDASFPLVSVDIRMALVNLHIAGSRIIFVLEDK